MYTTIISYTIAALLALSGAVAFHQVSSTSAIMASMGSAQHANVAGP